jgi:hypothetical protein
MPSNPSSTQINDYKTKKSHTIKISTDPLSRNTIGKKKKK